MSTVVIPEILLPRTGDMSAWAVVACDQFTSDKNYWRKVEEYTRGKLSAYNLILPEAYLSDDAPRRIKSADENMRRYLEEGVFKKVCGGFILVERTTPSGTRTGLVIAIDLEDYSFEKGAKTPVRSSEATIKERVPARVLIRKDAPIELPHVMLLYDDAENSVLSAAKRGEVLYDFDLNMGGGHVKGTFVPNAGEVISAFEKLTKNGMMFAVGDGNHSLAAAKSWWQQLKPTLPPELQQTHPARFALVEAVNIYDGALVFEPIHRLVQVENAEEFLKGLDLGGSLSAQVAVGGRTKTIPFPADIPQGIRLLDKYISDYIQTHGGSVDYIHGDGEVKKFSQNGGVGILLPAIQKSSFFDLILKDVLPKKTFSMGEGAEKRYYIEARAIR